MSVIIREYRVGDYPDISEVYSRSVRSIGRTHYSPGQVEIWASWAHSDELREGLQDGFTLVAEVEGSVVSFGQLNPSDHIHLLYTLGEFTRRGIGSEIVLGLEARAFVEQVENVTTFASAISRPLFSRLGYELVRKEEAEYRGLSFDRFQMRKALG